jgi:hypothetical protein
VVLPTDTTIGDVSATELGYVNGVTSGIQYQIDTVSNNLAAKVTSYDSSIADLFTSTSTLTSDLNVAENDILALESDVAAINTTAADLQTQINTKASSTALTSHASDTTDIHGIADTAALALTADVDAALDLKAPIDSPTFTGTVAGITKTMVGLGNVDNTSDANKPVSTATQTELDLKAPKAAPTFTGTLTAADVTISGNLTVSGTTTTVNTTNFTTSDPVIYLGEGNTANLVDIGFVGSYNDGTYAHQGLVKDSSDSKWKLFKGVTDEPTTTVNFSQGSLDDLAVNNLTAAGIVFSDGTQVKAGVPSTTAFATEISSSATIAANEQDKFVPLSGAVVITLPSTGYSTGQSIDFWQKTGTGASFASTNGVIGTPGLKFRTTNSVVTAMKITSGWLVFGDLSA